MKTDPITDLVKIREKSKPCKERYRKWARERVRKGYCDWDLGDTDTYLTHLMANMLNDFASNISSLPPMFETEEAWAAYLRSIADDLLMAEKLHDDFFSPDASESLLNSAFSRLCKVWYYLWE